MPASPDPSRSPLGAGFPARFEAALTNARVALDRADRTVSGAADEAGTLARLHELYRLRVEIEVEVAGVLWRTAEAICAMADATDLIRARRFGARGEWVRGAGREVIAGREARNAMSDSLRRWGRRPHVGDAALPPFASATSDESTADRPGASFGRAAASGSRDAPPRRGHRAA